MKEHGYTQVQLQAQTRRTTDRGYIWAMPDGKDWLEATRVR